MTKEDETADLLNSAARLEQDGAEFYEKAASASSGPLIREMFLSLARDERNHLAWIKDLAVSKIDPSSVGPRYRELLAGIFEGAPEEAAKASPDDLAAARAALEMETKSAAAYSRWAEETSSGDVRALCLKLAEFEKNHFRVIDNTIRYLESPGDWFMQEEQWNFEGG